MDEVSLFVLIALKFKDKTMIKIKARHDHNWTHKRFARTLREAFPLDNDLYLYPMPEHRHDKEDLIVLYACAAVLMALPFVLL